MSDSAALRRRYLELIDQIVQLTLKGNIRSKEQVYQMLVQEIEPETSELFEACLGDRTLTLQEQANDSSNEVKQAKASRSLRAIVTISGEWQRWQTENQVRSAIATAVHQILQAEERDRLQAFLGVSDPNRPQSLNIDQLKQLARALKQHPLVSPETQQELAEIAAGITRGLESWVKLQPHLVSWIYEPEQIGFNKSSAGTPWELWSKQSIGVLPKSLFEALHQDESLLDWASRQADVQVADWIELTLVMQTLERGLVNWAEQQIYSTSAGARFATTIFLTFGIFWAQIANGVSQSTWLNSMNRDCFAEAAFRVVLQNLRVFAQKEYFPLYGTFFATVGGKHMREAMDYLREPLKKAEGKQEQARIWTILGASTRSLGAVDLAKQVHESALEMAQAADDTKCQVANLNHLSRIYVTEQNYAEAIAYAQRALILSRQTGDPMGEANALTNLGYGEVFQAQQLEADTESYERAIAHLEQGLELAERLGDVQSKARAALSLGSAYVALNQPEQAMQYLRTSVRSAHAAGDLYLVTKSMAYLAEAAYQLQTYEQALLMGAIAMYQLEQMGSSEWRSSAGLLSVIRGQMGEAEYQQTMQQLRSQLIQEIGIDGYDHLSDLLTQYRSS
jgi:tetratricopeptide (TPR) repeat protein